MQQGDLVAIVRTGGGMGALQSFTTDNDSCGGHRAHKVEREWPQRRYPVRTYRASDTRH